MDAADLDDGSDGNDPLSAPSEFLAEFLSAIMQRQYAEALKYCRLILQYEPHNATARGFYPLLQHKVAAQHPDAATVTPVLHLDEPRRRRGSSSPESGRAAARSAQEDMEQDTDESASASPGPRSRSASACDDSCASQSSLEPDSSASAGASPGRSDGASPERSDSASGGWESVGTTGSSGDAARAPPDDNGNGPRASPSPPGGLHRDDLQNENDLQNDNDHPAHHKGDLSAATLRRLRAQFACSIK